MSNDITRYQPLSLRSWRDDSHIQEGMAKVYEILKVNYPQKYEQGNCVLKKKKLGSNIIEKRQQME